MQAPLRRDGERLYLFGVRVDNLDRAAALDRICGLRAAGQPGTRRVYFTNVHSIHLARRDASFRELLNSGDLVLGDGSGLWLGTRLLGEAMIANLNGTDLTPELLRLGDRQGWRVFLLGARPSVLAACQVEIARRFPGLHLVGAQHGFFTSAEELGIVAAINNAAPDLLLCALGSPRQESFLAKHATELHAGVSLAVGGLFDFISGDKARAPRWLRHAGLEFLYRLAQDPRGKWQRVFVEIPEYLGLVLASLLMQRLAWRSCGATDTATRGRP